MFIIKVRFIAFPHELQLQRIMKNLENVNVNEMFCLYSGKDIAYHQVYV